MSEKPSKEPPPTKSTKDCAEGDKLSNCDKLYAVPCQLAYKNPKVCKLKYTTHNENKEESTLFMIVPPFSYILIDPLNAIQSKNVKTAR
jgi:hypothetical protein